MLSYNSLQTQGCRSHGLSRVKCREKQGVIAGPLLWRLNSHQHSCISFLCGPRCRGNGVHLGIPSSSQNALTVFMVLAGLPCTAFCDPMGPRPFGSPVPSLGVGSVPPFKFFTRLLAFFLTQDFICLDSASAEYMDPDQRPGPVVPCSAPALS